MFLLDSNIVVYKLQHNEEVLLYLERLGCQYFSISIVTRLEVLLGYEKDRIVFEEMEQYLDDYENIDVDEVSGWECQFFGMVEVEPAEEEVDLF